MSRGLADAVKELGGDEEDLKLIDGLDSDSEYEGQSAKSDKNLLADVDGLWAQLSGKPVAKKTSKKALESETTESNKQQVKPVEEKKPETKTAQRKEARTKKKLLKEQLYQMKKMQQQDVPELVDTTITPFHADPAQVRKQKQAIHRDLQKNKSNQDQANKQAEAKSRQSNRINDLISSLKHPGTLLIDFEWHSPPPELHKGEALPQDEKHAESLKTAAMQLLETENRLYLAEQRKSREYAASAEFLRSGTFSDQLGTLSLLATESPLHSMHYLETLLDKCSIKSRESAARALEVVRDLIVSHILPDRRLLNFSDQKLGADADRKLLISAAFEDWLKQWYFRLLQVVERLLSDTVENVRLRTLHAVFALFLAKPEQEQNLLRLGVNKLGDPAGKIASRVKSLVSQHLEVHPAMKPIVANAVSEFLGRSKEYTARYYAVDLLSEFVFARRDPKTAERLVLAYLSLLERLLAEWDVLSPAPDAPSNTAHVKPARRKVVRGKKGGLVQTQKTQYQAEEERNARLVAKIFTGLNRAFPFAEMEATVFERYVATLYKMTHSSNTSTAIEALAFIFQLAVSAHDDAQLNRFYRTLYNSISNPGLYHASKLGKYIALLIRALAADTDNSGIAGSWPRRAAFAKRLLATAAQWPDNGPAAALVFVASRADPARALLRSRESTVDNYAPDARDPEHSRAETSSAWELAPLLSHYHPTVRLYAQSWILDAADINGGEPLNMPDMAQYSVSAFLDRWSYKKPRERESTRGHSIFQPLQGFTDLVLGIRQERSATQTPLVLQDWWGRDAKTVKPDERFAFEYFSKKQPRDQKPKKSTDRRSTEDGEDPEDEDEDEEEIFDAIMRANPDEMGSGSDADFSDMDSADNDDGGDDNEDNGDELHKYLEEEYGSDDDDDENASDTADADSDDGTEKADFLSELMDDDLSASGADSETSDAEPDPDEVVEGEVAPKAKAKAKTRKRKQEWATLPTFMDADAFEEYAQKKARR